MKGIECRVEAIVIPSGGSVGEDLQRAERAIQYNRENSLNTPYIISGVGPDINIALGPEMPDRKLDFHRELYEYMMDNTDGIIGVDIRSVDSIGNILNTFPEGTSGTYLMVSYPLHLMRLKLIAKMAQKRGKISRNVKIKSIPTEQSCMQVIYETIRIIMGKGIKDLKRI